MAGASYQSVMSMNRETVHVSGSSWTCPLDIRLSGSLPLRHTLYGGKAPTHCWELRRRSLTSRSQDFSPSPNAHFDPMTFLTLGADGTPAVVCSSYCESRNGAGGTRDGTPSAWTGTGPRHLPHSSCMCRGRSLNAVPQRRDVGFLTQSRAGWESAGPEGAFQRDSSHDDCTHAGT